MTAPDGADGTAGADRGAGQADRAGAPWSLRPATLEDVEEIAFAELELFPDEAWSVFQLAEEIEHPDRRYVVAVEGEAASSTTGGDGPDTSTARPHTGADGSARRADPLRSPDGRSLGIDRAPAAAAVGGALLGYAGIMLAGDLADLHTIGTRREGEGIGRALLAWCEQQARDGGAERMLLEVREDNTRARAVYAAAGYREIGWRRGYYRIRGRRIDALVMERELGAPGGPSA